MLMSLKGNWGRYKINTLNIIDDKINCVTENMFDVNICLQNLFMSLTQTVHITAIF